MADSTWFASLRCSGHPEASRARVILSRQAKDLQVPERGLLCRDDEDLHLPASRAPASG